MDRNKGVLFRDDQEVIAQSEGYAHRVDAVNALARLGVAADDVEDLEAPPA